MAARSTLLPGARRVLDDCRYAHRLLEQETTEIGWRVHWVAAIALLRMVGHVLAAVDSKNPEIAQSQAISFEQWKSEPRGQSIFLDFIMDERNAVLKEYRSSVYEGTEAAIAVIGAPADVYFLDGNIFKPMLSGPWAGEDARDLLEKAIEWWASELDAIEARVRS